MSSPIRRRPPRGRSEFLGIPWNDKCLDFHNSDRPVKTASVAQVRKPIYKTAVKRWKNYGDGLRPLIDAIEGKPEKNAAADASRHGADDRVS